MGVSGWLTRHSWVPAVVNHQLEDLTLVELRGLALSRTQGSLSAHIAYSRLVSGDGLVIDIEGVRLTELYSVLSNALGTGTGATPTGQLYVKKVVLSSAASLPPDSPERPALPSGATSASTEGEKGRGQTRPAEPSPFVISETLRTLQSLPVQAVEITQLSWPERFKGSLSLSAENNPGQEISAQILSTACPNCGIGVRLQNLPDRQATVQAKLSHENHQVCELQGKLTKQGNASNQKSRADWALESRLIVETDRLGPLLRQLDISLMPKVGNVHTTEAIDWSEFVQSLSGEVELNLAGEMPDALLNAKDLSKVSATLNAPSVSAILPTNLAGIPLALEYSASGPLSLGLQTVYPLAVTSVQGQFHLQVGSLNKSKAKAPKDIQVEVKNKPVPGPVAADALLGTDVTLATDSAIPTVRFKGRYYLDRAAPLLSHPKWQAMFGNYTVSKLSGVQSFSGEATLPSLEDIGKKKGSSIAKELSIKVEAESPIRFALTMPAEDNPLAAVNWQRAKVKVTPSQPVTVSAQKIPGDVLLSIPALEFELSEQSGEKAQRPSGNPVLSGSLANTVCRKLPAIDCTLSLTASLNKLELEDATLATENLEIALSTTVRKSDGTEGIEIVFSELNLLAEKLISGAASVSTPELFTQKASCRIDTEKALCESPQLALSIAPLSIDESRVSGAVFLRNLTLENQTGKKNGLRARADFQGQNLNVQLLSQFKATIATDGKVALTDGLLTGDGEISSGPLNMNSVWKHSLDTGQGNLQLNLAESAFSPDKALTQAIQGLPVDIVDGSVSANLQLHWPERGRDKILLSMQNTGFQYNDSFAVGVTGTLKLEQNGDNWVTQKPARVSIDTVDTGVKISNLHFDLTLAADGDLTLKNFAAELLEGALTSEALTWNLNGDEHHSLLQFTGISIGALAREMESQNFAASGLLDASIPLVTDQQGITVENGSLQSRAPGGRLRYYGAFSPAMLGSNPQLKLLAGALEDYNYRDIRGTITYPLSGDLKLNLKLTGRSDAIDANRDLIINLNLENNIPTMLRSLQASRDLTDVLEQQVQ
ncbi:intermembrane phospholipid transport protein YdbH family protein [Microbulbifer hydrolyticus]|uniref:intermembrane phospholipid transport protein YdbH family protein n=1 Tax=Microbulbifer hydrolyticus TaxID=48074 RepID=UPI004064242F